MAVLDDKLALTSYSFAVLPYFCHFYFLMGQYAVSKESLVVTIYLRVYYLYGCKTRCKKTTARILLVKIVLDGIQQWSLTPKDKIVKEYRCMDIDLMIK